MYKGKDFGTPFKKKGVHPLVLREISTWGWYLYGIAPRAARLRHIVTCDRKSRAQRGCDILSHWQLFTWQPPEGGLRHFVTL